ncbi:MAG TPA: DUF368 domain-containing protein [Pseudogracilibacillus sp.]|nr:DUF368 domain-containing protein [Pseudogracilibacillus sp.]
MQWQNIYRGFLMGVSDIVPGVSGGTIAVLLGIYDRLIASINGLFSKDWKRSLGFLIPLGVGAGTALFSLSHLMEWLLLEHPVPTFFTFIGLIIGVLPFLFNEAEAKTQFGLTHYLLLVIGVIMLILLPTSPNEGAIIVERTLSVYIMLFFAGFLASTAMILPGISGSLILMIIGFYATVINGLKEFDLLLLIVVASGILVGLLTMSKIIHYFLKHYRTQTYALIIGLVIGSIFVIFPGMPIGISMWVISFITFVIGLLVAFLLGKIEY